MSDFKFGMHKTELRADPYPNLQKTRECKMCGGSLDDIEDVNSAAANDDRAIIIEAAVKVAWDVCSRRRQYGIGSEIADCIRALALHKEEP